METPKNHRRPTPAAGRRQAAEAVEPAQVERAEAKPKPSAAEASASAADQAPRRGALGKSATAFPLPSENEPGQLCLDGSDAPNRSPADASDAAVWAGAETDARRARYEIRRLVQAIPVPAPQTDDDWWETWSDADSGEQGRRAIRPVRSLLRCGRSTIGGVAEVRAGGGRAAVGAVETCGRAMVCPFCAVPIREARRAWLEAAMTRTRALGGRVYLLTLTMRHYQRHKLVELLALQRTAWSRMASGRKWHQWSARFGIAVAGAIEVTYGRHGWHAHQHLVVLVGVPRAVRSDGEWTVETDSAGKVRLPEMWTRDEEDEVVGWLRARWVEEVEAAGLPRLRMGEETIALDWRYAPGGSGTGADDAGLAAYLAKTQGGDAIAAYLAADGSLRPEKRAEAAQRLTAGLAAEVTRGDRKRSRAGRMHRTRPVLDLAVEAAAGDAAAGARWWEYETAMRGLRWWRASMRLGLRLGLPEPDARSDAELAAQGLAIERRDWWRLATSGQVPELLEAVEKGGVEAGLAWLDERRLLAVVDDPWFPVLAEVGSADATSALQRRRQPVAEVPSPVLPIPVGRPSSSRALQQSML